MCVPLFDQIRGWVFEGRLSDPHLEFFIVQQAALSGGGGGEGGWRDPWREGYRIEGAKLPPFINRWGERCIRAAVRACGAGMCKTHAALRAPDWWLPA